MSRNYRVLRAVRQTEETVFLKSSLKNGPLFVEMRVWRPLRGACHSSKKDVRDLFKQLAFRDFSSHFRHFPKTKGFLPKVYEIFAG